MHSSRQPRADRNSQPGRKRLGERLVETDLLTEDQLTDALLHHRQNGDKLGQTVIELGFVTSKDVCSHLEQMLGIPYVDVTEHEIPSEVFSLIGEQMIRKNLVLPLRLNNDTLEVAMVDPLNLALVDDLKLLTGHRIEPRLAMERDMLQAINRHFDVRRHAEQAMRDIESDSTAVITEDGLSVAQLIDLAESSPTIRLVNSVFHGALSQGASDIHLEPQERELRIRYRVDGMLRDAMRVRRIHQAAIVSRVKVMARLNIAERRRPQDGRIAISHNKKEFDLRISIMPTIFGEKIVTRVLDKSSINRSFERIGFIADQERTFEWFITRPHGMILVTGPTGSGKSTTLYAALSRINTPEKNIITIEDPVEYQLPGVTQTAVNERVNLTFANGLRTIVRQDPDVIMVGEVRDRETAEIAVQAALTGHLVFTTLHTNDAPGALVRLMNMGIEPFLIASSVVGVVAQRLVRVVCPDCRELYSPGEDVLKFLGLDFKEGSRPTPLQLARGKGCATCHRSGFLGRTAVMEVLKITNRQRELVLQRTSAETMRDAAVQEGMRTMRDIGMLKVIHQISTPEEIMRTVYVEAME